MEVMKHSFKNYIGYWLSRLRTEVHTAFEQKIEGYKVTVPQWNVLLALFNKEGESVGELARFTEVDKGFISRLVDQLVRKKLVVRKKGADRRSGALELTQRAKELVPLLIQCAETNEKEFFGSLTKKEEDLLRDIFSKLLNNAGIHHLKGWFKDV